MAGVDSDLTLKGWRGGSVRVRRRDGQESKEMAEIR